MCNIMISYSNYWTLIYYKLIYIITVFLFQLSHFYQLMRKKYLVMIYLNLLMNQRITTPLPAGYHDYSGPIPVISGQTNLVAHTM